MSMTHIRWEEFIVLYCKLELSEQVFQHSMITVGAISCRHVDKKFIVDDDRKASWFTVHFVCPLYITVESVNELSC